MGLVGESGSGKSITAKSIMRLAPGNAIIQHPSQITLNHQDQAVNALKLRGRDLRLIRGGAVSMIFQEPMVSFAPAIQISEQIIQTMQIHLGYDKIQARRIGIMTIRETGERVYYDEISEAKLLDWARKFQP